MADLIACTPKYLPVEAWPDAAERAIAINPANRPQVELLTRMVPGFKPTPEHIVSMTSKYWQSGKVALTVSFLDVTDSASQDKILSHMNAWAPRANVIFTKVASGGQVRIASKAGDGHWSYIGADILSPSIASDQPTMNLDSFSLSTPDSEYRRVVRHQAGHTLGFIHEHMRQALVDLIDRTKAYPYFLKTQGWNKQQVDQQVLTPIEKSSLMGRIPPDPDSIMCYQIPGSITKSGQPIPGGQDIDESDYNFAAKLYPPSEQPPTPTPTPTPAPTPGTGPLLPDFEHVFPTPPHAEIEFPTPPHVVPEEFPTPPHMLPEEFPTPPHVKPKEFSTPPRAVPAEPLSTPTEPATPTPTPPPGPAAAPGGRSNATAIVGVLGLAAVMGMVAAAGVVAVVAISKERGE